jgi:hypothetical protein
LVSNADKLPRRRILLAADAARFPLVAAKNLLPEASLFIDHRRAANHRRIRYTA